VVPPAGADDALTALALLLAAGLAAAANPSKLDEVAERYVKLALALGQHDPDYVDAYYGPPAWKEDAAKGKRPRPEIRREAVELRDSLLALAPEGDEMVHLRHRYLMGQLGALVARIDVLDGKKMTFDEESKAIYDVVVPPLPEAGFEKALGELEALLPGPGPLTERYDTFRKRYLVPADKLDAVFTAAIEECRARTRKHVELPPGESFTVEYVKDKSWSAYNWYKGGSRSVIQVNTDLPVALDRVVDLACHEGYPGHHVYNALLEKELARGRGWVEFMVYPLFSPQSLIAEGTGNFGIEVAFPGGERAAFERDRLVPLAGLDPKGVDLYRRVQEKVAELDFARTEAARRYLDGKLDAAGTVAFLRRYALQSEERARQQVRFFDQYRSYILNYNYGQELVRRYVESRGGTPDQPARRWQEFVALLASPRLPGGLQPHR
jgi:hypothetical protein